MFPPLPTAELDALAADIQKNGLLYPIKLYEGQILDGRNRYLACLQVGVTPRFEQWAGDDPYNAVWSLNVERRHLEQGTRAVLYLLKNQKREEWLKARQALKEAANKARSAAKQEAVKSQPKDEQGKFKPSVLSRDKTNGDQPHAPGKGHSVGKPILATAAAAKVSPATAARAESLVNARPDLALQVAAQTITLSEATRQKKKDEVKQRLDEVAAREVEAPTGLFDVIVIDPPWPMEKIERDERPNQVGSDYPTMSEEDLAALSIPAAENCHVWLWTTHKFLPMAFRLLAAWKLKYVCCFVWHKPGGFQPIGLPQLNCEFALYALAAPSTPDAVVEQALEKAEAGDKITLADVQEWKAAEEHRVAVLEAAGAIR